MSQAAIPFVAADMRPIRAVSRALQRIVIYLGPDLHDASNLITFLSLGRNFF
jgi:hypothetical protein